MKIKKIKNKYNILYKLPINRLSGYYVTNTNQGRSRVTKNTYVGNSGYIAVPRLGGIPSIPPSPLVRILDPSLQDIPYIPYIPYIYIYIFHIFPIFPIFGLVFGCLDLYVGCLDSYLGFWTYIWVLVLSLGATLVIGCYSCHWMLLLSLGVCIVTGCLYSHWVSV